jgi:hypothetical protein
MQQNITNFISGIELPSIGIKLVNTNSICVNNTSPYTMQVVNVVQCKIKQKSQLYFSESIAKNTKTK